MYWGAKTLAPWAEITGVTEQWATSAAAAGFRTGSQPQVGAIACWNDGGYGHVAVVTAVDSTTRIQVSESNYGEIVQSVTNVDGSTQLQHLKVMLLTFIQTNE